MSCPVLPHLLFLGLAVSIRQRGDPHDSARIIHKNRRIKLTGDPIPGRTGSSPRIVPLVAGAPLVVGARAAGAGAAGLPWRGGRGGAVAGQPAQPLDSPAWSPARCHIISFSNYGLSPRGPSRAFLLHPSASPLPVPSAASASAPCSSSAPAELQLGGAEGFQGSSTSSPRVR